MKRRAHCVQVRRRDGCAGSEQSLQTRPAGAGYLWEDARPDKIRELRLARGCSESDTASCLKDRVQQGHVANHVGRECQDARLPGHRQRGARQLVLPHGRKVCRPERGAGDARRVPGQLHNGLLQLHAPEISEAAVDPAGAG